MATTTKTAEDIAKKESEKQANKNILKEILKLLKEIFDRVFLGKPAYYKPLEELHNNLEELTFQNVVTSEILNDIYTVVSELRGNIDNMSVEDVSKTVNLLDNLNLRNNILVEVSGGINEDNILDYASLDVDIISLGALTHSVNSLNFSLDIK